MPIKNALTSFDLFTLEATKLNRVYELKVEGADGTIFTFKNPLTVEFEVNRANLSQINEAKFTIMNLNEQVRNVIHKDQFDGVTTRRVEFWAGYNYEFDGFSARCFFGEIRLAYSVRSGNTFRTYVECWDGGKAASVGYINQTFDPNLNQAQIITSIAKNSKALPNIDGVVVSDSFAQNKNVRAQTYVGPTVTVLSQITAGKFYIDNQTAYVLNLDEVVQGAIEEINDGMVILDTPAKTGSYYTVSMLFEPRITISQNILLNSTAYPMFNGNYKVVGITHQGVISESVNGPIRTTVQLYNPDKLVFKNVSTFTPVVSDV